MTLNEFKEKLQEYATNNISAYMGKIQITENEKTDLLELLRQLPVTDQAAAAALLREKGVDVKA